MEFFSDHILDAEDKKVVLEAGPVFIASKCVLSGLGCLLQKTTNMVQYNQNRGVVIGKSSKSTEAGTDEASVANAIVLGGAVANQKMSSASVVQHRWSQGVQSGASSMRTMAGSDKASSENSVYFGGRSYNSQTMFAKCATCRLVIVLILSWQRYRTANCSIETALILY